MVCLVMLSLRWLVFFRSSKGNHLSLEGRCYGVFVVKLVMACCWGSFYVHRVLSEFGKLVVMVCRFGRSLLWRVWVILRSSWCVLSLSWHVVGAHFTFIECCLNLGSSLSWCVWFFRDCHGVFFC